MQIFSKLQRNSSYQIFIKLFAVLLIALMGSFSPFFPIMLGVFVLCGTFFTALFFVVLFSILHDFNLVFFVALLLVMKTVLIKRLKDIVNFRYQDALLLFLLYSFTGAYLLFDSNVETKTLLFYLIYNFAFDLLFIRGLKCELNSF